MIRKIALVLLGALALLVVAIVAVPRMIDFARFEPRIAAAVADATGRTIRIDGEIGVQIVPDIAIQASGIHLENPQGFEPGDMASIESVRARLKLLPLLSGRLVVEELVVERPQLALVRDENGNDNWSFATTDDAAPSPDSGSGEPPISDLVLGDVRIVDGSATYTDRSSGVAHELTDLGLNAALGGSGLPLVLDGGFLLNGRQVALASEVAPFDALLNQAPAEITARLNSDDLTIAVDSSLTLADMAQGKGRASIETPSVGNLAEWLQLKLAEDPGPLRLAADFESSGEIVQLNALNIEGDELAVDGSARLAQSADGTELTADLRSTMIDLDRYLPAPTDGGSPAAVAAADDPAAPQSADSAEGTIDLSALRRLRADVKVAIEGVKARGLTVAPIELEISAADGVLQGDLGPIGLLGGTVSGALQADATADPITASVDLAIADLDLAALPDELEGSQQPLGGIADLDLAASTDGNTVDELAANLAGELRARLHGDGVAVNGIEQVDITLRRADRAQAPSLNGTVTYNGEPVELDITADGVAEILNRQPFELTANVRSAALTLRYAGNLIQQPVISLDGTLDADIESVARLAAWLGQPFPPDQPDPGALSARATLQSDGAAGKIEEFRVTGDGLDLNATGSFDASSQPLRFDLAVEGGVLELDRYLPQGPAADAAAADEPEATAEASGEPVDLLSDEPIDLSALSGVAGTATVTLEGVHLDELRLGASTAKLEVGEGRLDVALDIQQTAERSIVVNANLQDTGDAIAVAGEVDIAAVEGNSLAGVLRNQGLAIEGRPEVVISFEANGASPRALAGTLLANAEVKVPAIAFDEGPLERVEGVDIVIAIDQGDAGARLAASAMATAREGGGSGAVKLDASSGSLANLLGGEVVPIDLQAAVGEAILNLQGEVALADGADAVKQLTISFEAPNLNDIAALSGQPMPPAAPVSFTADFASAPGVLQTTDVRFQMGESSGGGNLVIDTNGPRPRLTAEIELGRLDLEDVLPAGDGDGEAAPAASDGRVLPDDPLPLEVLQSFDASVHLRAEMLVMQTNATLENVDLKLALEDGKLTIDPLEGGHLGGTIAARADLDSRADPPTLSLDFAQKDMQLGYLLPILKPDGESAGQLDAQIKLDGQGRSVRAIAGSLNGRVGFAGEGGSLDSDILQLASVGLLDIFGPIFKSQGNTFLNCGVGAVDFENGVGTLSVFLIDMPAIAVGGGGSIDLTREQLDMQFNINSKNKSLLSLVGPFNVTGSLAEPQIALDAVGTAVETAITAGLTYGVYLNPLTALGAVAVEQLAKGAEENPCVAATQQASGQAPAADQGAGSDALSKPAEAIGSILKGLTGGNR